MYTTKSVFFLLCSAMLTSVALCERQSIFAGGGAGGGANDRSQLKAADASGSPTRASSNNNQGTTTNTGASSSGGSYNSGSSSVSNQVSGNNQAGGINGNGTHGTLADRQSAVTCPICVGTWYENVRLETTGTSSTCGKLQESVQDVTPQGTWCRKNQLLAESGGCCKTITFSNVVANSGSCDLCSGGSVPSNKFNELKQTGIAGQHRCGSLASALKQGILFEQCDTVKATTANYCCHADTINTDKQSKMAQNYLRGAANEMP